MDVSCGVTELSSQIVCVLHDGHIGIVRMKGLTRSYIWWPDLDKDIEGMSARCEDCKVRAAMPTVTYHPWQYYSAPWDRTHIDFGEWEFISLSWLCQRSIYDLWLCLQ